MAAALPRRPRSGRIPRRTSGRNAVPLRTDPKRRRRLLVHREPRFSRRARTPRTGFPPRRLLPTIPYWIGTDARARPSGVDGSSMTAIHVVGDLDANFAWDGERLYQARDFAPAATAPVELRGSAASVAFESPSAWRIVRDPLGINKLFWAATPEGLILASRPKRLIDGGCAFDAIRAIPRASVIDLSEGSPEGQVHRINPVATETGQDSLAELAPTIRSVLDRYLVAVAEA